MAVLFVDESGEEGFSATSSEWFILGGALQKSSDLEAVCKPYDAFKATMKQKDWFFHFQTRQHHERLAFIRTACEAPYQGFAVIFHKPSIVRKANFQKKYYLYFYALRFLLERATRWAKDTAGEPLHLMLSSRGGLDKDSLRNYFTTIQTSIHTKRDSILWDSFIQDEIHVHANREFRGLQVADCIASATGQAIEYSKHRTLEPRYILDMKPIFARHPYQFRSCFRIWPDLRTEIAKEPRLDWFYGRPR